MKPDSMVLAKSLYQASPAERVSLIRNGVPASRIVNLVEAMHVSREHLLGMLNLPSTSIRLKIRQGAMLATEQAERVVGLERLIGQIVIMVEDSGDPKEFDAAGWVGEWLERPLAALGGAKPADFMDTMTGQTLVSSLLVQVQAGVFT
ncbi:antitoxin Xre/MbcA/ParS toxin-binding domain-containing protein [Zoogloea sp. LCSB751]|uniref:antitoxin Xre/MbcA/ParS toxin-binding domain-containing protein n=1 Tax=Zoogloea sp. LCSB751 TaxID=1965277 RepID=UPI0013747845|nr:antitoxin Xre/MbcA/ParS toxin-binding domain-containing protein [Zoogloea sp. LCSB751]